MRRGAVRLVALTSSAVALLVVLAATIGLWRVADDQVLEAARAQTAQVAEAVRLGASPDELRDAIARTELGARGLLGVRRPDGSTIGAAHAGVLTIAGTGPGVSTADLPDGVSVLREMPAGRVVVEAFIPDGSVWDAVWRDYLLLGVVAAAAVCLAALAAALAVRPMLENLKTLRHAVIALRDGDLGRTVRITGPPELTRIAGSLNGVSQRVRDLVSRERAMVADLSHRMRTPLTALRLDADAIGPGPLADRIRQAVATLDHDLAEVIRSAASSPQQAGTVCDAAEVVATRMRFWSALAEHQRRPCRFDGPVNGADVALDGGDVAAVVDALVTNVFQHTSATTPIHVTLVKHAGWVNLVVEDGGNGVTNIELALRRGGSSRGSTGLGLAIARETAASCGGSIRIDRGSLGGARIHLRLSEFGVRHDPASPLACRILPRYRDGQPSTQARHGNG